MVTRLSIYYFLVTVLLAHREAWGRIDQIFLEAIRVNHFIRYMIHKLHQQLCISHAYHSYVDVIHNTTSAFADIATLITRSTASGTWTATCAVAGTATTLVITAIYLSCRIAAAAGYAPPAITVSAYYSSAAKTTVTRPYSLGVWHLNVHRLLGKHFRNTNGNAPG